MVMRPDVDAYEISDLVLDYDSQTLERRPVRWRPVLEHFQSCGNRAAVRVVRALPKRGEYFDEAGVDGVLVMSHMELQRVEEEFLHGHRVLDLVRAMVRACEAQGVPKPWRIVDVGCGLGYVVRWLTSFGGLGADVELVGVDYNQSFIRAARRLAELEGLRCHFEVANAFELDAPATLYISSGVLHHFRGQALHDFFAAQASSATVGFLHTDILPSRLAPLGAWIYHQARMRQALARHDGYWSARRAHPGSLLTATARAACPEFRVHVYDRATIPVLNVFQSMVGVRPELEQPFYAELSMRGMELD